MNMHVLCQLAAAVATTALLGAATIAVSPSANAQVFLDAGEPAAPPRGAFALCAEDRQTCGLVEAARDAEAGHPNDDGLDADQEKSNGSKASAASGGAPDEGEQGASVTMTDEQIMAMAQVVNARINAVMLYRTDRVVWGVEERWVRPLAQYQSRYGDCEDFALEKRASLMDAGVPAERLRMAVAWSRDTGLHAVLIVRTAQGDFVLDNAVADIRRVDQTGYEWRSVQSGPHLLAWSSAVMDSAHAATTS